MALKTTSAGRGISLRIGKTWNRRLGDLATHVLLTIVGLLVLFPFVWMMGTALKSYEELFDWPPTILPAIAQWSNFPRAWNYTPAAPFTRFFINSGFIAICATLGQIVTCTTAGYAFAGMRFPGRNTLFLLYIATLMVPFQVTLVPLYLVMKQLHWINTYQSLIVPALVSAYGTFLLRQFMLTLPKELEIAARVDGASPPLIFLRVILPLCGPAMTTLSILAFMGSWNAFLWPLIMISKTEYRTIPIGLAMFTALPLDTGKGVPEYQLVVAAAAFSMVPTLLVFLVGQRYFIKGIALSGLKGWGSNEVRS